MVRRFSQADLPDLVPVFPLPRALLLPGARLPLNIFEPRYLAMVDDALKSEHRLIGMVQPRDGQGDPPGPHAPGLHAPGLHAVGCAGRLTSLNETDDGRYLVVLTGISRFRILEEVEGFTAYRRVRPDWSAFAADPEGGGELRDFDRDGFLHLLRRYFDVVDLELDWDSVQDANPEMLIDSLSMVCPFDVGEKQALLEARDLAARAETLTALMHFAVAASGGGEGQVQ